MKVEENGRVQVAYVVKLTSQCPSDGLEEEIYESVEGLRFKKANNKWCEDGIVESDSCCWQNPGLSCICGMTSQVCTRFNLQKNAMINRFTAA